MHFRWVLGKLIQFFSIVVALGTSVDKVVSTLAVFLLLSCF